MTEQFARYQGIKAFENGHQRAPTMNPGFMKLLTVPGIGSFAPLFAAYLDGWDKRNCCEPIDGFPGYVSVHETEVNEIKAVYERH